jgi:hypothetical protein
MTMEIYLGKILIVIETNFNFAIPYWKNRKRFNKKINWKIIN